MRNRLISLLLTFSIVISVVPRIALEADAVSMWFYPVIQHVKTEIGYEYDYFKNYRYGCGGTLVDFDRDGVEELFLKYCNNRYDNYYEVWDLIDGNPVCVMEYDYYSLGSNFDAYFSTFEGKEYFVVYIYSGGSGGGRGVWSFYDPMDAYNEKISLIRTDSWDGRGQDGFSFKGQEIDEARYDALVDVIQSGTRLVGDDSGSFSFDELSSMSISSQLIAYSDHHDLSFEVGDVFEIRCVLQENGYEEPDWRKPSFVIGDSKVISVEACEKLDSGYCITVKAIGVGSSSLTVVESDSSAFVTVNITVRESDERPHGYLISNVPEGYPEVLGDRDTLTNFYNFNGLYINKYKYSYLGNDNYQITFDVYNQSNMYGSVDIYDKNGKWIGCQRIEKYKDPTSIYETGENTLLMLKDTFTMNLFSYTASTVSEKTSVQVEVPFGGYVVVSNNYFESPGTYLYNTVDYMIFSANLILKTFINSTHLKEIQDQVIDVLTNDDAFTEAFLNEFSKITVNTIKDMTNDGVANSVGALTAHAGDFFTGIDLDFWSIVSTVTNIGEDVFLALTMAEVAVAMKGMFAVNESLNYLFQARDILRSETKPYIVLYTQSAKYSEETTINGVTVTPEREAVPGDAVLQVFRIADDESLCIPALGVDSDRYKLYNICYTVKNEQVQPTGKVTVQLPIPQEFDTTKCVVLHQQEDLSWKLLNFTIQDGYAVFTVDHFSLFALVQMDRDNPFEDVQFFQWYTEPVLWAVEEGITNGMDANHFAPDGTCTRAQIVTFLWRANGSPKAGSANNPFSDVPAGQWYTEAVLWAVEKGITTGISETTFSPDASCTRAQVTTFLWRSQNQPSTNGINIFTDIASGSYYYDSVLWAVEQGITNGMGDGIFAPDATCTRGQIVTFLYRCMK